MNKNLPIDSNSRPIPALEVGFGQTYNAGIITDEMDIIRIKAIGDTKFRLAGQEGSEIIINDGETEYFKVPNGKSLEIISGSLNIMM